MQRLQALCRQWELLLIFDEVMTGFGRTGELFAAKRAGVRPDIICLAKGLTGGCMPLSVTVASDAVFEAFLSKDVSKTFYHGHSYTANPLGCQVAVASCKLLEQKPYEGLERRHLDRIGRLQGEHFTKTRVMGTIAAVDVVTESEGYTSPVGPKLKPLFYEQGVLLRPLGNVVYILPPYCITDEELDQVYGAIERAVAQIV